MRCLYNIQYDAFNGFLVVYLHLMQLTRKLHGKHLYCFPEIRMQNYNTVYKKEQEQQLSLGTQVFLKKSSKIVKD